MTVSASATVEITWISLVPSSIKLKKKVPPNKISRSKSMVSKILTHTISSTASRISHSMKSPHSDNKAVTPKAEESKRIKLPQLSARKNRRNLSSKDKSSKFSRH